MRLADSVRPLFTTLVISRIPIVTSGKKNIINRIIINKYRGIWVLIRVESALGSEFVFAGFAYFVRTRLQPNVALSYDNRGIYGIYRRAIKCDNFVFFFRQKKPKKKQRIASRRVHCRGNLYILLVTI